MTADVTETVTGNRVTILGSANLDHVLVVPRFPRPGETLRGTSYTVAHGGKGANQAMSAACTAPGSDRASMSVQFIGAVGNDAGGQALVTSMADHGVNTAGVVARDDALTGAAFIHVEESGENCITLVPGANDTLTALTEAQCTTVDQSDWLLLQHEVPAAVNLMAARRMRARGGKVVLNPAPVRPIDDDLWSLLDILTPNQAELAALAGTATDSDAGLANACSILHDKGIPLILVTLGPAGVWVSEKGSSGLRLSGFRVCAVDTTGAGDNFNGTLVGALAAGKNLDTALRRAQAAAALQVTRMGAQSAIPSGSEVDALLDV